jgi:hypothetical protein
MDTSAHTEHPTGVLSLIAAGERETVPMGVPFTALGALASLDTPEVGQWLADNRQFAVYVVAGTEFESEGVPALSVPATPEDYELVLSAMPR